MAENKHERLIELDIAKGFAVIFMILVHVSEMFYCQAENGNDLAARIIEFLGSPPTAPVFMVSLGAGIVYSRHQKPEQLARRGLKLLAISYIYNVIVYTLPYVFAYFLRGHDRETLEFASTQILSVDILQFAGFAFLFMALAIKLHMKDWQLISCAVIFSCLGKLLESTVKIKGMIPAQLLGSLWRSYFTADFPFFSWIFFPIAGYVMARSIWPKYQNKNIYYGITAMIGLVSYLVLSAIAYYAGISFGAFGELYQDTYYGMGLYGNVCLFSFVVFWIAICFYIGKILPHICKRFLVFLSRNITWIYICQYFLIYYIQVVVIGKENSFSLGTVIVLAASIGLACCIAVWIYAQWKSSLKENR